MAQTDFSKQFDDVSERAKAAANKVKAASAHSREQLEAEAAAARDKASQATERFKEKAAGAQKKASSQWQDAQEKWHKHVEKVRESVKHTKAKLDAKDAAHQADLAEAYALDAIAFSEAVIEEAASATLDAMYLRAYAQASAAKVGP